jgi:hypothetical protein
VSPAQASLPRSWPTPELRIPNAAAQTRIVSKARIRLDSGKSVRSFKGIICDDVSEFESYMASQAVRSLWAMSRVQKLAPYSRDEAIARALQQTERRAVTFECGGPRIYSYEELLRAIAREAGLVPRLMPLPFAAWHALASIAEVLPSPPVTRNQIELMQIDNVASRDMPFA